MAWLAATPPATTMAFGSPAISRKARKPDAGAVDHHVDDRRLEAGAEVGDVALGQGRDLLGLQPQGGLQAGEREIRLRPAHQRAGQVEAFGIALPRLDFHVRTARIGQAQELRHLVEGFADGVVDGGADAHVIADPAHRDELGMPARGQQQQIGKADAVGQARGERMGLEMVDRHQRLAGDERDRLGGGEPDQHAADQAGAGRDRDAVEIPDGAIGVLAAPARSAGR